MQYTSQNKKRRGRATTIWVEGITKTMKERETDKEQERMEIPDIYYKIDT